MSPWTEARREIPVIRREKMGVKSGNRGGLRDPRAQYAALPWRRAPTLEIMLVSSRDTNRWVLPKGWPMKGRTPHGAAAMEAWEEAGILGKIAKEPVGSYHYLKRRKNGSAMLCEVTVFPFAVERERKAWLEQHQRIRKWFGVRDAADAVEEPELRQVILEFGDHARLRRDKDYSDADGMPPVPLGSAAE